MKLTVYLPSERKDAEIEVDHDGIWVQLSLTTMSPAEAKALAAALVHYAERAQKVRDELDG